MGIKNIDIAKILNVSPSTVSLARNFKAGVSEETRQKVFEILRNNGIQVNGSTVEDKCIMLVMHKTHGQVIRNTPFFQNMLESIQHIVTSHGYQLLVQNYAAQYDIEPHLHKISMSPVSGILLLASEMNEEEFLPYKNLGKPVVVVDAHFPNIDIDVIGIDNEFLIRKALSHLREMGHSKIGFLASYVFTYNFQNRLKAYQDGMLSYGLAVHTDWIFYLHSTAKQAYLDMKEQLSDIEFSRLPTAFIAGNDLLAMGAMKALKEKGLRIPEDISLVGFDNMPVTNVIDPPLTSIDINSKDMDVMAVESILRSISETSVGCCRKDARGKLIVRESVLRISGDEQEA